MDSFKNFVIWEKATRDTIDVKRCYVDITGDLVTGILFSQIIYWFLPNRRNQLKVKIQKQGRYWLCKERKDWWDECRITEYQFDRAIKVLCNKKLTIKKTFKFNGTPKVHITINFEVLREALKDYYKTKKDLLSDEMGLSNLLSSVSVEETHAEPKKSYLSELRGMRLDLFNMVKDKYNEKGIKHPVKIVNSDVKLKEYLFEHFWNLYKRKKRKPYVLRKFKALKFSEINQVFKHVEKYVATVEYRLGAHNYLADKAFQDEIAEDDKKKEKVAKNNDSLFDRTIVNKDKDTDDYYEQFKKKK